MRGEVKEFRQTALVVDFPNTFHCAKTLMTDRSVVMIH